MQHWPSDLNAVPQADLARENERLAANWLDEDFAADVLNRKWARDISYIWTAEGWLFWR